MEPKILNPYASVVSPACGMQGLFLLDVESAISVLFDFAKQRRELFASKAH